MIKVVAKGNFDKTEKFLNKITNFNLTRKMESYGREGVSILKNATPKDTGKTAASWRYEIEYSKDSITISWINDNMTKMNIPVAVLIQYGHGTKNGGYVQGIDYINPAMKSFFEKIANDAWKEVTNA